MFEDAEDFFDRIEVRRVTQQRHQFFFEPDIDDKIVASAFQQHGDKNLFAALRHDHMDIVAATTGDVAAYFHRR